MDTLSSYGESYSKYFREVRKIWFDFETLPAPSERLTFEKLSYENAEVLYALFRADPNPFVDKRFKNKASAREYLYYLLEYARFSPKRGGADWFFKTQSGAYAGIVHLYDLNLASEQVCTIGFTTAAPFRRQGLTQEAVRQLVSHCVTFFERPRVQAHTRIDNTEAIKLLLRMGFNEKKQPEQEPSPYRYFEYPTIQ